MIPPLLSSHCLVLHLKWVILRRNLLDKVISNDWDVLHNVLADPWYAVEEEERKDPSDRAKRS